MKITNTYSLIQIIKCGGLISMTTLTNLNWLNKNAGTILAERL